MPAQQLQILFEVADKPGISANELKQRLGVAQSSISRGLKALGWGDERVPGKYLIENRPCPDDSRRRLHFLTARGVVLMDYLNGL
jgi:DNA-binding MarR family transcriptional regulator